MENQEEIWYDLIDYEVYYEMSNLGRVRSKPRIVKGKTTLKGTSIILKPSRILRIGPHSGGYMYVQLTINSKEKNITLHRYIAKMFIPNPENKPHVNHINGIKTDNRIENLEWCTAFENMQHAYKTGLQISKKGEDHFAASLTNNQVLEIRRRLLLGERSIDISRLFNIPPQTIYSIKIRKTWKHI